MQINYPKISFFIVFLYIIYLCVSIINHDVLLADDLSKVYNIIDYKNHSFNQYLYYFINSETMAPRPISGLITGIITYMSKFNSSYYYIGLFFFPLSYGILYYILKKCINESLSALISITYAILLIGSSIQFSSIMLNSNLALIFFLLSLNYIKTKNQNYSNLFLSSILFTFSIFSYEIFMPCIVLNMFFIRNNRNKFLYFISTALLIIIYRKGLQPLIFTNVYHRESMMSIFDFKKNLLVIIFIFKMFLRDFFVAIYKGFLNIHKVSFFEWLIIGVGTISVFIVILKEKLLFSKNELYNLLKISVIGLILSFLIFFFSTYKPTLFGFDNRNLGAVRLFFSLFSICFLLLITIRMPILVRGISVSIFVFSLFVTNLAIKEAWIYANNFNNKMFHDLSNDIKDKKIDCVSIDYDVYDCLKNNNNLILREPTFINNWESNYLCYKNGIDIKQTRVYSIERKKCKITYQYPIRRLIKN